MDANKDGVVTKEELTTLLKGLGEAVTDDVVDEMIKIADENGDGKIQFEEFVKAATEGNMWACQPWAHPTFFLKYKLKNEAELKNTCFYGTIVSFSKIFLNTYHKEYKIKFHSQMLGFLYLFNISALFLFIFFKYNIDKNIQYSKFYLQRQHFWWFKLNQKPSIMS